MGTKMKYCLLIVLIFLVSSIAAADFHGCVYIAINASQRQVFSQYGYIPGFGPGCLVIQNDTSTVYEWNGSSYTIVGPTSVSGYVKTDGSTKLTANWDVGGVQLKNIATPTASADATTKAYVDTAVAGLTGFVKADGSTKLTGNWDTGGFNVTNVGYLQVGTSNISTGSKSAEFQHSIVIGDNNAAGLLFANGAGSGTLFGMGADSSNNFYIGYEDSSMIFRVGTASVAILTSAGWNMLTHSITNLADPSGAQDAATKNYVDTSVKSLASGGTNANLSASAGSVVYSTSTGMAMSAVGTAGQVLISNGVLAPAWQTVNTAQTIAGGGTVTSSTPTNSIQAAGAVNTSTTTVIASGSFNGQRLTVVNVGANTITFKAGGNTDLPSLTDYALTAGGSISFMWDTATWYATAASVN